MAWGIFQIPEYGTPPGWVGDTVYRSAACQPGDVDSLWHGRQV
jgi:hypothetical protein